MNYKNRRKAFQDAWTGILISFKTEIHFRFHLFAALLIFILIFIYPVTHQEQLVLVVLIGLVLVTELINTAFEKLCDYIQPEYDEKIGQVKDIAAGAVLLAASTALIAGIVIFLPYVT